MSYDLHRDRGLALRVCEQLARAEIERVEAVTALDGRPELSRARLDQLRFTLRWVEHEIGRRHRT